MKYPYRVIKSGVLYPANTEVPDDEVSNAPKAEEVAKPEDDSTNADGEAQTPDPEPDADGSDDGANVPTPDNDEENEDDESRLLKNEESENDEQKQEHNYTKTDVNRMLTTDLHTLAKELGIEGEADKSGAQLKVEIINKLGL